MPSVCHVSLTLVLHLKTSEAINNMANIIKIIVSSKKTNMPKFTIL